MFKFNHRSHYKGDSIEKYVDNNPMAETLYVIPYCLENQRLYRLFINKFEKIIKLIIITEIINNRKSVCKDFPYEPFLRNTKVQANN